MKKLKTTSAPSVIMKIKELKPNTKITLFNIAYLQKTKTYISQTLLASMGGVSRCTISRCLDELEEKGYINRITKLFNGKGKETTITIIWDKIKPQAKDFDWYGETTPVQQDNTIGQPITTAEIEEILNEDIKKNTMGNITNITLNPNSKKFEYTPEQKEEIKDKIIAKNTPQPVKEHTPIVNIEMSFGEFVKEYKYNIREIIDDLNEGGMRAREQAPERLKSLLNTKYGRMYKEQVLELINHNIKKTA